MLERHRPRLPGEEGPAGKQKESMHGEGSANRPKLPWAGADTVSVCTLDTTRHPPLSAGQTDCIAKLVPFLPEPLKQIQAGWKATGGGNVASAHNHPESRPEQSREQPPPSRAKCLSAFSFLSTSFQTIVSHPYLSLVRLVRRRRRSGEPREGRRNEFLGGGSHWG